MRLYWIFRDDLTMIGGSVMEDKQVIIPVVL